MLTILVAVIAVTWSYRKNDPLAKKNFIPPPPRSGLPSKDETSTNGCGLGRCEEAVDGVEHLEEGCEDGGCAEEVEKRKYKKGKKEGKKDGRGTQPRG